MKNVEDLFLHFSWKKNEREREREINMYIIPTVINTLSLKIVNFVIHSFTNHRKICLKIRM